MASIVVGVTGVAGSGKSEVAKLLTEEHGFATVKFAGPLKDMVRAYYRSVGLLDEDEINRRIEGDLKEVPCSYLSGRTPREAMITLGTEWGRQQMHPDFWVNAWSKAVDNIDGPVVADDVRFDNEAARVYLANGVVLKVEPKKARRKKTAHASEEGISPNMITITIPNKKTLKELRDGITSFLSLIKWFTPNGQ